MYKIKFDGALFGDIGDNSAEDLHIFDAVLDLRLNSVGYFTFKIYPTHRFYQQVSEPRHIIEVYRENSTEPLFVGRLASYERGLYNELTVTFESEIAFLMDSIISSYTSQVERTAVYWLRQLISMHNNDNDVRNYGSICSSNIGRKFEVGNVSWIYQVTMLQPTAENFSGAMSIYEIIMKLIVEPLGGVIKFRHENGVSYIDLISENNITVQGLDIAFGRNLIDIELTDNVSEIVTAIRPLGAPVTQGGESVPRTIRGSDASQYITGNDIKQAINTEAAEGYPLRYTDCMYSSMLVEKYGWILREVRFDDALALKSLTESAQRFLENCERKISSEFRALSISEANREFVPGDKVRVNSEIHGINNMEYLINSVELHLFEPELNIVNVGSTSETLTMQTGGYSYSYDVTGGSVSGSGRYDAAGAADAAYEKAKSYTDRMIAGITIDSITTAQIDALFAEG